MVVNRFRDAGLASPFLYGMVAALSTAALSAKAIAIEPIDPASTDLPSTDHSELLRQLEQYSPSGDSTLGQVTSITQFSDVQPTDWAYQALQSLVERYGCIVGYPDGTYRGQSALTRYEFAAGLNACLDRISELIAASTADLATQEDLATLQRLQEEFAAELATLRGRVDSLEARVSELEENQFSTTTVLSGETQILVGVPIEEDDTFDDQPAGGYRVRLNFDTSFTGEDRLRARLQATDLPEFEGDQLGYQAGGNGGNDVVLDDLIYSFPIGDRVEAVIGANGIDIDNDFSTTISPLDSSSSGALSEFADPRQYEQAFPGSGFGAGANVAFIDNDDLTLRLDFGYVADDATTPTAGNGLFNGAYATQTQLTLLSDFVDLGIMYSNSYTGDASDFNQEVYTLEGPAVANTYGAQVNFKVTESIELGGGVAFSNIRGISFRPDFEVWSYQGTLAIRDLGGEGNLLGVLAGVLPYTRDLEGQTRDTSFLGEVFYRFNVNDNIAITPSIIVNTDPNNDNDNDATVIGTLRTTFRF
ncbi:MAG: iron uptake porin [Elainellaceae cyanobacterium]